MAKAATPKKPLTKTELLANIATATDVPKKQVIAVLEALASEIFSRSNLRRPDFVGFQGVAGWVLSAPIFPAADAP